MIQKWGLRKGMTQIEKDKTIAGLRKEMAESKDNKRKAKLMEMMVIESRRYHKKISYLQQKINLWESKADSFTFKFEGV